jgi:ribosome-associated translation inhibitor RaiA
MKIQVHHDNHIAGHQSLLDQVRQDVEVALARFADRITRIEVHLSDVNGKKVTPDDRRCLIEAHVGGRPPVTASDEASGVLLAVNGAAEKLARVIEHALEKQRDESRSRPSPPIPFRLPGF